MSLKDESGCVGEQIAGRKNRNRETVGSGQRGDISQLQEGSSLGNIFPPVSGGGLGMWPPVTIPAGTGRSRVAEVAHCRTLGEKGWQLGPEWWQGRQRQ